MLLYFRKEISAYNKHEPWGVRFQDVCVQHHDPCREEGAYEEEPSGDARWGKDRWDPQDKRFENLLGNSHHGQATHCLLCPNVQGTKNKNVKICPLFMIKFLYTYITFPFMVFYSVLWVGHLDCGFFERWLRGYHPIRGSPRLSGQHESALGASQAQDRILWARH